MTLYQNQTIRTVVRAGAIGAWAPAKIWQWVPGTHPGTIGPSNTKNIYHGVNMYCKNMVFEERTAEWTSIHLSRKIGHPSCENPNEASDYERARIFLG